MRGRYLFLILFFVAQIGGAQGLEQGKAKTDTMRCFQLNRKIEEENDHRVWIRDNNDLKKIAAGYMKREQPPYQNTFRRYYAIALLNEGAYYNYTDRYELAIDRYRQSFRIARKSNFLGHCASCLQNIGTAFDYLGKVDSSLVYFEKALVYARKSRDKSNIAYVLTDLGHVYNLKGNTTMAIGRNIEALKVFEEIGDAEGIERTYTALGRIFDGQKEYLKAIGYYRKGLAIATQNKFGNRQAILLNSLANSYFRLGQYEQAERFAKESMDISTRSGFGTARAVSLKHLGEIALSRKQFREAEAYFTNAAGLFEELHVDNVLASVKIGLGQVYLARNDNRKALYQAESAFRIAQTSNYPTERKAAAELLTELHSRKGDYETAFQFQTLAKKLADSIFYDESKNIALKSEFRLEAEKKEARIALLSQQKKISELELQRQKVVALSIVILLSAALIIGILLFKRYRANNENRLLKISLEETAKTLRAEKKASESELKALKSQMNPHFIFNALNSIQEQFMYGDKRIANEQMGNFTDLTRMILNVSGKQKISLGTEIDILTKYLELEKMRFDEDFEYTISVDDGLDPDFVDLPPMLVQPFVENSIKHGLLHKQGNKSVLVRFAFSDDRRYLVCTVEDNGIGREKSEQIKMRNKHNSFSTASIEERLKLMEGDPGQPLLWYEDLVDDEGAAAGTRVTVRIHLEPSSD
ncbi:MAG TPA: tetratricopeptide repeat protein [Flavobacterium sp.]|nr:tetratricopeptide repeat protein [Flavobacterium sp.]